MDHNPITESEIRELARAGRKIEAIKRLREATGVSLAEAKDAVERIAEGFPAALPPVRPRPAGELDAEVRRLVMEGQKIAAIKRYREVTGTGLKEAKEAVERIAAEMPGAPASRSGCLGLLALLPAVLAAGWLLRHILG